LNVGTNLKGKSSRSLTKIHQNVSIIILCHPREDGDPVYNYIQNSDFSLDSHLLRGNDNLCQDL